MPHGSFCDSSCDLAAPFDDRSRQLAASEARARGRPRATANCQLLTANPLVAQPSFLAAATTFSAVMPSSFMTVPPGAERPKRSMPTTAPSSPTYLAQVELTVASMATRLRHDLGSTSSR